MDSHYSVEFLPQEKAFHNVLIFDCIIGKMNLAGFKNARLVCKSWRLAANYEMIKRPENKLEFERNDMPHGHKLQQKHEGKKGNQPKLLSDLNFILKTSEAFPCRFFSFKRGWMAGPIFKNFFHFQGKQIETLIMNEVDINPDTFMHMVSEELPNLKKLSFNPRCSGDHRSTWSAMHDRNTEFKLPSLEILQLCYWFYILPCYAPFAKQMISAAPKLKSVGDLAISYIIRDFPKDKIHLIKECCLLFPEVKLEDLEEFISLKPKLTILKVAKLISSDKNPSARLLVAQLLRTCSETLIRLWAESLYLLPIEVEMKSLTHLTVEYLKDDQNIPVSAIVNFCPRLKFIQFQLYTSHYDIPKLEEYFQGVGNSIRLASVKHVAYTGNSRRLGPAVYSGINVMFPNLINLSLSSCCDISEFHVTAMFEKLRNLKGINFTPYWRVSREDWQAAILNGEAKTVLKLICDEQIKLRGQRAIPWEEPQLFSV